MDIVMGYHLLPPPSLALRPAATAMSCGNSAGTGVLDGRIHANE